MRPFLLLATLWIAVPAAAQRSPPPPPSYTPFSVYGSQVILDRRGVPSLRGELLAVSDTSLWLGDSTGAREVALSGLRQVRIDRHLPHAGRVFRTAMIIGSISGLALTAACSSVDDASGCGGVFIGSMLVWSAIGGLSAASVAASAYTYAAPEPAVLQRFARYPQGMPPDR